MAPSVAERKEQVARVVEPAISTAVVPQRSAETTPATVSPAESGAAMFERLARDPAVDVDKLERLMAMQERGMARIAEERFNAAMSTAQSEMRAVAADASNPQTRSRYASYSALDRRLRPIYTGHDFGLSFDTGDSPLPEHVRVLCYVTHADGHSRTYHVDMPADGKGAKGGDVMTKTHAVGAAMSYGMRYLLKMIFNVAVGEDDDDGNSNGGRERPQSSAAPTGFDDWWTNLTAVADNGLTALETMWRESNKVPKTKAYCDYASKVRRNDINALKAKAGRVAAS